MIRFSASLPLALMLLLSTAALADEGGIDASKVLAPPPTGQPRIVVQQFSTTNTDFGTGEKDDKPKAQETARQMQASAPIALAQSLVNQLESRKVLGGALLGGDGDAPEGALQLRGEFTVLNPGSRGKRFWVGMGAGRSRVCVKGELVDAEGQQLLTFEHCRSGTGAWSFVGGRAEGMMINDLAGTAEKVSAFLDIWSRGGAR